MMLRRIIFIVIAVGLAAGPLPAGDYPELQWKLRIAKDVRDVFCHPV